MKHLPALTLFLCFTLPTPHSLAAEPATDIVIYGATSSGIAAAIQARRMGRSVILLEPTTHMGGLTTGGLGQTDIGNKAAIGGISREFYQNIRKHYDNPAAWKWQKREQYKDGGQTRTEPGEPTMWTFEPSAATKVYNDMLKTAGIEVLYDHRLDRKAGVKKDGASIVLITMENGKTFTGRMFIDATYEGDLMASAGVSYTVGREGISQYNESIASIQPRGPLASNHNFVKGVDPYITKGDKSSGLLPFIDPNGPGTEGAADKRVQAYCFRMCLTDHPENRIPFHKPDGYDEQWYELLFRNYEAGYKGIPWSPGDMPNRKTDTNNNHGYSTDFIGQNYDYPEASYEQREKIIAHHLLYQQGLMWTLANHPRVPENIRKAVSRWGMSKDEFVEGNGWQRQLYIREARRMVGPVVMTQHHCQWKEKAADPVGMAAYGMDSHHMQRYVDETGHVRNEGNIQAGVAGPFPISYQSIVPKENECTNLLVPVCLSASHVAFGSIRMEPVFMVLGQSAATAASHAIDENKPVQQIDYPKLQQRLLSDKQVLEWKSRAAPSARGIDPRKLPGIILDDEDARLEGQWLSSSAIGPFIATGYHHDNNANKGQCSATFTAKLKPGRYEVRIAYTPNPNRSTNTPVAINHVGGPTAKIINQQKAPPIDNAWLSLGAYDFQDSATVTISNKGTTGHVIIDAIQFLPAQ